MAAIKAVRGGPGKWEFLVSWEGYDDDGNELLLTRRSKGRSGGRDARSKEHRGGGAKRKTSTGKGTGYRAGIQ